VMEAIVDIQQDAAKKNEWAYVDLFHPMTAINLTGQKTRPDFTITGPDRIHPGRGGHLIIAELFLENQGLAGKPVASVELNAKTGNAVVANAEVQLLDRGKNHIRFHYLAKS